MLGGESMKVLLTPHVEHYTVGLAGELSRRIKVELLAFARYPVSARQMVVPRLPVPGHRDLLYKYALKALARRYDVVHVNTASHGALLGPRDNLLLTEHGWPEPELVEREQRRFYEKERESLLQLYEAGVPVVTISNFSARMLRERLGVKATAVVYHGVLDTFRRNKPLEPPIHHVVLWNSRLVGFKEPFTFLEAIRLVKGKASFEAVIRGDGPLKREVEGYLRRHGLEDTVRFAERIPFEKLPQLYRSATIFIHTCSKEPFGLAVLEAMASGLPVIVPDAGGAAEVAGDAGLKFRPGDSEDLAEKLLVLLTDQQLYETFSARSIERSAFFTWEKAASTYLDLYRKISGA
ncbi:glycosyltransferase family 4 protein [Thermofilum pendens]|nr:glycosyltransferase family 4 protein [Thermofilum pendens]